MNKYFFIFFLCIVINSAESIETRIIHVIEDEVITNIDIKNQFKYLSANNKSLNKLDKEKILSISNESIIREKIKKVEIKKNFREIKLDQEYSALLIKNIYLRLNLKSVNEFNLYLKDFDLTINDIKDKITIDALWNELVIQKYGSKVTINEDQIKKEILKNKKKQSKEYRLSEITFEVNNKAEIEKKYDEVVKSVNEIGFENSAAIYSISESSQIGGDIGWISENSLNDTIRKNVNILKIGDITKPIILSNGIMLLKLIDVKSSEIAIDIENEFKRAINFERNRQLNQYSKIYFNKVKKNLDFNG